MCIYTDVPRRYTMHDILTQDYMHLMSTEWSVAEPGEQLTLASAFQFVKCKMYAKRDMCIIADDSQRRDLCVALYEYTHRVTSMSDADVEFVGQYDSGQRYHVSSRRGSPEAPEAPGAAPPAPPEVAGILVYM